jgi:hypothetical protein
LTGDGDWSDSGEYNDDRTHNAVNELTGRDTDDNGTDNFTLTYDELGNLTDDGENYTYKWDAFGRWGTSSASMRIPTPMGISTPTTSGTTSPTMRGGGCWRRFGRPTRIPRRSGCSTTRD